MTGSAGAAPRWRRVLCWLAPSLAAAGLAVVAAGLAESIPGTYDPMQAVGAAGFVVLTAAPASLLLALVARAVWRGWQPEQLFAQATGPTGGAPRVAAWVAYLLLAAWFLTTATFNIVRNLAVQSPVATVVGLGSAFLVVAVAGILVAGSRPAVRGLSALLSAIDRRAHRRFGRSPFGPRSIIAATVALVLALLWAGWHISVAPRIGPLDTGFVGHAILAGVVLVAVHLAWPWLARRRLALPAFGLAVALTGAAIGAAGYLRYQRPYAMLEIWGETRIAGASIDALMDIQELRGELRLEAFQPTPRPGASHPDIILITIDTVRADRTPPYGGPARMPALEELAGSGTVLEWAFAPGNVTRRSLPTMATGVAPARMSGRVAGWALRLDPRHVTVAERLRAGGYDTAGFFCCDSQFGPRHQLGLDRGLGQVEIEYDGAELARQAAAWLRDRYQRGDQAPLFLWLHFIEPHNWELDDESKERKTSKVERYDASLERTDAFVTAVLRPVLSQAGDRTVITITSDHGEGLGDRGQPYHATNLHNSQIRVPWIFAGPGITDQRIKQPVGLIDLAPTLLDLAGFVPPGLPQMDGVSLAPLLRGEQPDDPEAGAAYAVMLEDRSVDRSVAALVRGRYKLVQEGDRYELYDLFADPDEDEDLAGSRPELLAQMKAALAEQRRRDTRPPF